MNIAIVDDEMRESDRLSEIIKEYASLSGLSLTLSVYHNAEEILDAYKPYAYTAIFMDIYMAGQTGVDAARKILGSDRNAIIIFLTSSEVHMPDAFSIHAYDYINKPAEKKRIFKVLDDVLIRQTEFDTDKRLCFESNKETVSLAYHDILYVKTGERNYLEIMDGYGNTYTTRLTFSETSQSLLSDKRFLLILRGILVNMDYITRIKEGICYLTGDIRLPVNVKKQKELETIWQNYALDRNRNNRTKRRSR